MKRRVATQRLDRLDAAAARDQWVGQRLQRFVDAVVIVSLSEADMPPARVPQVDPPEKLCYQDHVPKLRKTDTIGSNAKISRSWAHCWKPRFYAVCNIAFFEALGKDVRKVLSEKFLTFLAQD